MCENVGEKESKNGMISVTISLLPGRSSLTMMKCYSISKRKFKLPNIKPSTKIAVRKPNIYNFVTFKPQKF